MNINEREAGTRSPVAEQTILDMLGLQRFIEQRIVAKVDHSQAKVIAGSPVEFGLAQFFWIEWLVFDRGSSGSVRAEFKGFGRASGFDRAHKSLLADSLCPRVGR